MFSILLQLIYRCLSLGIIILSVVHQKCKSIFSRRLKSPYQSDNWNLRDLYMAIQLSDKILPAMIVHKSNLLHNIGVIRSICEKYNKKLRLASKSVRVPGLMQLIAKELDQHFQGLMSYNLREACWLVQEYNFNDILMGYPTSEKGELFEFFGLLDKTEHITLMIDSEEHVHTIDHAYDEWNALYPDKPLTKKIKLCLDVDMSLRVFDCIHLGVHRSPIRSFRDFRAVTDFITKYSKHCRLTGVMGYEAQVAGLPDKTPFVSRLFAIGIYAVKKLSVYMSARKRRLIHSYLEREGITLEIFNGGGTGSLLSTSKEPWITEITAGSGFLQSTLFDYYRTNKCLPAFAYALRVTRIPENDVVVCQSGGFVASPDKLPQTFLPRGLTTYPDEGFGEVQTPFKVNASVQLDIGDIVLLRPAKAGEIAERFDQYLLWDNKKIVDQFDTYRGLNKTFF